MYIYIYILTWSSSGPHKPKHSLFPKPVGKMPKMCLLDAADSIMCFCSAFNLNGSILEETVSSASSILKNAGKTNPNFVK